MAKSYLSFTSTLKKLLKRDERLHFIAQNTGFLGKLTIFQTFRILLVKAILIIFKFNYNHKW